MEIGAVIFMIVALICYAIIANSQGDGEIKGAASNIDNLLDDAQLAGASLWTITIFRKSGYLHDVREFRGDANEAITKALASCRRSGIYNIIITKNEPAILEFYSANQEGRGKAIGGFRLTPADLVRDDNIEVFESSENADKLEELEAQIQDTKRTIAKMLFNSVLPSLSDIEKKVLSTLSEDQIITAMSTQLNDHAEINGQQMKFNIPINYKDEAGNHYSNIALTIKNDDAPLKISDGNNRLTDLVHNSVPANQTEQPSSSSDPFGFPERDAWEGSGYEIGGHHFRCDVKLGFRYTDSNGAITNRQIHTKAFVQWNDDDHLVLGFCNYRKANRSFVTSRMEGVVDLETGECIDDIDHYLTETYAASDYKKVDEFINRHMSVVDCLLYLAKLDGNITPTQRSLVIGYIKEKCGVAMVTDLVAKKLIKDFADDLTPQKFRKLISQMRKEQPENIATLLQLGRDVVDLRRGGTAGGQAALASILNEKK
jgi:hypothetical protein